MDNGKTMLERLTTLLNKSMILYMKNDITYKGIYRGLGKKKKLVFDLSQKITKVGVENCQPLYEKKFMHSTEYINPEDLINFEIDTKKSTESNPEVPVASQDGAPKVPAANVQNSPGNPAAPRTYMATGWIYHPANLNGQIVLVPQLYHSIPYIYYPAVPGGQPLKPAFRLNIQPIQIGIPNLVPLQSEPVGINNKAMVDHKFPEVQSQNRFEQQPNCSHDPRKNPCNLKNQATNGYYGQELDVSPTILHSYSITQLMGGIVPGVEEIFQQYVSNVPKQPDEEFEFEPTVGVFPVKRLKQIPTVNEDKNSFENKINPVKINNDSIENAPDKIDKTPEKTSKPCLPIKETHSTSRTDKPDNACAVDYLSVPYALINIDKLKNKQDCNCTGHVNTNIAASEVKYTLLKKEKHKSVVPSSPLQKVSSKLPDETDLYKMSSEEFEAYMIKSLGEELMALLNVSL